MEEKDLIKKLEETSLPEIEIPGHRARLRMFLLNKYFPEKRSWQFFDIFKKIVPVSALTLVLLFLIFNNLIFPRYTIAKATEIALRDPQIKELIEKGGAIKDAKIVKNRAYILIQISKEEIAKAPQITEEKALNIGKIEEEKAEKKPVALAEINIKERKVAKIEKIVPPVIPLTESEKEKIREIVQNNPEIQEIIPKEAEVLEIISPPPQLELIRKGNSVEVLSKPEVEKKASIIYQSGKNQWEGKVNLSKEKVEEIKFLGETEE